MTAGDLANCCIVGGHRPPLQRESPTSCTFCAKPRSSNAWRNRRRMKNQGTNCLLWLSRVYTPQKGARYDSSSRFVLLAAMTALGTEMPSAPVTTDQANPVTFNKDVLPILQNNCQTCHRPSGIAPMSLLTYENARPWAKAIKAAVVSKVMPPWFADPHYGEFKNAPKLTESDIRTLVAWTDSGAREGNPADKP